MTTQSQKKPFNSRPHKEVDNTDVTNLLNAYLSIHDLTRRSTPETLTSGCTLIFQFTTSQGGRPYLPSVSIQPLYLSIHDLTRRSTSTIVSHLPQILPFNSRPHKEVDSGKTTFYSRYFVFQFTTSQGGRLCA